MYLAGMCLLGSAVPIIHDVLHRIEGPAALDAARHFIERWNFTLTKKYTRLCGWRKHSETLHPLMPMEISCLPSLGQPKPDSNVSACHCQILRSVAEWSCGISTEQSIHEGYINMIGAAKHFIYIEVCWWEVVLTIQSLDWHS